jgi:hypothetical protein
MSSKPFAVCLMLTFNRYPKYSLYHSEALASFFLQDYPHKKLVVINCQPKQKLISRAKAVEVLNFDEVPPSMGEAYNEAIRRYPADIYLPWDDDDICLPWRISLSVEVITSLGIDYWIPRKHHVLYIAYHDEPGLEVNRRIEIVNRYKDHGHCVCHNASAFTHRAWEVTGGYPPTSGEQDYRFDEKLISNPQVRHSSYWPGGAKIYYVYRWTANRYANLSLMANASHDFAYNNSKFRELVSGLDSRFYGQYELARAMWLYDYVGMWQG